MEIQLYGGGYQCAVQVALVLKAHLLVVPEIEQPFPSKPKDGAKDVDGLADPARRVDAEADGNCRDGDKKQHSNDAEKNSH